MNALADMMSSELTLMQLFINVMLGIVIGYALGFFVKRFSSLVGNKYQYYIIFPVLIPTMVLIISIIKSSLALSLGLVGALSIVRFRTPIKEPEELVYIFVAISCGLGLGADQTLPTILVFGIILLLMIFRSRFQKSELQKGTYLDISTTGADNEQFINAVSSVFKDKGINSKQRRLNLMGENQSALYLVEAANIDQINEAAVALRNKINNSNVTIIDRAEE